VCPYADQYVITFDRYAQILAPNGADVPKCELLPPRTRAPEMSSKNFADLSFGTFLSLLAATVVAVFFGTRFLLLTYPWDEMPATRSKTAAATAAIPPAQTDTAAAATAVSPPAQTDTAAAATAVTSPTQPDTAAAATTETPQPDTAAAATTETPQTDTPAAATASYSASSSAAAFPSRPRLFAAKIAKGATRHAQPATNKGIFLQQHRDARIRFLRQQQARLELQLTEPNLSAAKTTRLERQKAYWARAIEQTLALP
jgi:hypothetical protein